MVTTNTTSHPSRACRRADGRSKGETFEHRVYQELAVIRIHPSSGHRQFR